MENNYVMTREEALKKVWQMSLPKETMEILEALAPELKESEDERIRKELINQIEKSRHHPADKARWIAYLEKQKEQKPAEWSEGDEKTIDIIVSVLGHYIDYKAVSGTGSGYATPRYSKEIDWLKSLKPQSHWKPTEKEITALENLMKGEFPNKIYPGTTLSELLTKLKKLYYNESIPSWKPSEEQMNALYDILHPADTVNRPALESLYEQLKKL